MRSSGKEKKTCHCFTKENSQKILVIYDEFVARPGHLAERSHAQVAATKVPLQRWTAEGLESQETQTLRFQNVSSF